MDEYNNHPQWLPEMLGGWSRDTRDRCDGDEHARESWERPERRAEGDLRWGQASRAAGCRPPWQEPGTIRKRNNWGTAPRER